MGTHGLQAMGDQNVLTKAQKLALRKKRRAEQRRKQKSSQKPAAADSDDDGPRPCRFYFETGVCRKGIDCDWSHEVPEMLKPMVEMQWKIARGEEVNSSPDDSEEAVSGEDDAPAATKKRTRRGKGEAAKNAKKKKKLARK